MTTAAATSARSRRGRWLIVGDTPELSRALANASLTSGPPILVHNLFEAMGEMTAAPAGSPIVTVILTEHVIAAAGGFRAIEALRKIDPSARLVLLTTNAIEEANNSIDKSTGVDRVLATPLSASDLHRLLADDGLTDATVDEFAEWLTGPIPARSTSNGISSVEAASVEMVKEPQPTSARKHSSGMPPSRSSAPAPPTMPAIPAPDAPMPAARPAAAAVSAPQPAAPESGPLGDIDLVEAILHSPQNVLHIALQLIAQQTNWHDIALIDHTNSPAAAAAAASVSFANQQFGHLTSAHASPADLQPWADWLARWLALDHAHRELRLRSLQDELTNAGNRRFFDEFLRASIARAAAARRPVTLMVFDIDNFKSYNDQFGHDAGDEILRETVRLMQTVIRKGDRVCRIGGDEFAVIFADDEAPREPGSRHPETIETIAKRFQDQICKMKFPKLGSEAPGTLTISAGLATYPWDGADPNALLRKADQLALESKRKGKNIITFGKGAQRACGPESPV